MSLKALTWAVGVRGVSRSAKLLLICLADCHNKVSGLCFPDQSVIAEEALMSLRTASACLAELEEAGLISRKVESKGRGLITHYTLHIADEQPQAADTSMQKMRSGDADPENEGTSRQFSTDQPANSGETNRQFSTDQPAKSCSAYIDKPGSNQERTGKEPSVPCGTAKRTASKQASKKPETTTAERVTKHELQKAAIYSVGLALLKAEGTPEPVARKFLGGLVKRSSVAIVHAAVQAAAADPPIDARSYLSGVVERKAKTAGMRRSEPAAGAAPVDLQGDAVDWAAVVARYVRSGIWPNRLGNRPDEIGYRGALEPLEAIMANGKFGQLNVENITINIDRLRAARAA